MSLVVAVMSIEPVPALAMVSLPSPPSPTVTPVPWMLTAVPPPPPVIREAVSAASTDTAAPARMSTPPADEATVPSTATVVDASISISPVPLTPASMLTLPPVEFSVTAPLVVEIVWVFWMLPVFSMETSPLVVACAPLTPPTVLTVSALPEWSMLIPPVAVWAARSVVALLDTVIAPPVTPMPLPAVSSRSPPLREIVPVPRTSPVPSLGTFAPPSPSARSSTAAPAPAAPRSMFASSTMSLWAISERLLLPPGWSIDAETVMSPSCVSAPFAAVRINTSLPDRESSMMSSSIWAESSAVWKMLAPGPPGRASALPSSGSPPSLWSMFVNVGAASTISMLFGSMSHVPPSPAGAPASGA